MKTEYLGFVPAIILVIWLTKDANDDWEHSFLRYMTIIINIGFLFLVVIGGLLIALKAL